VVFFVKHYKLHKLSKKFLH